MSLAAKTHGDTTNRSGAQPLLWVATLTCLLIVAGAALLVVPQADTVYDEGGYLYEGWAVVSKGWRPFADFHSKVLPGLFYVYGAGQCLLMPSVLVGRLQATVFALVTLLLSALLAVRLSGNRWAGVLVLGLFAFNLQAAVTYYRALAIAPTGFFLMAAVYLVLVHRDRPWRLYVGCLAALAVGLCRHDMLPVAMVIWLYVWLGHRGWSKRHAVAAPLTAVALLVAVCLYYYSLAPHNFLRTISVGLLSEGVMVSPYSGAVRASAGAIAWHLMMFVRWYIAPILLLAVATGYALSRWLHDGQGLRDLLARNRGIALLLACAAVNYGLHAGVSIVLRKNIFYMLDMYIFFLVAVAVAAAFVRVAQAAESVSLRWSLSALGLAAVLVTPVANGIPHALSGQRPTHLQQVATGAEAIERLIPEDEWVFTLDDPHIFLEAGRKLYPQLTHQLFLYAAEGDPELIRKRHYFDRAMIDGWLSGEARYAVISDGLVDWMVHSGRYEGGEALRDFIFERLESKFRLMETIPGSYAGPTHIYQRRPSSP